MSDHGLKYLPISWKTYHSLAQKLAAKISAGTDQPQEIVAIARGGLTLGHLLSDFLRIPISTITIQSYTDIQKQGELKITHGLQSDIAGKHVLLVDDVSDSGKTLKRATAYLSDFKPRKISVAALFLKPRSDFRPDFFAAETDRWILFPYEPTEMISLLMEKLEKEGKSREEIEIFLGSLKYSPDQIDFANQVLIKKRG